jgi:hypothetical protein
MQNRITSAQDYFESLQRGNDNWGAQSGENVSLDPEAFRNVVLNAFLAGWDNLGTVLDNMEHQAQALKAS